MTTQDQPLPTCAPCLAGRHITAEPPIPGCTGYAYADRRGVVVMVPCGCACCADTLAEREEKIAASVTRAAALRAAHNQKESAA